MDQQSGDTTDKRNWRERLGIGKTSNASDLPKLSNEFKDERAPEIPAARAPAPRAAAHTPIKAAPMAPRAAQRAGAAPVAPRAVPAPAAPRQAPVAPDALASKLRDQREAAERLAQQRIQAAKARTEGSNPPAPAATTPSGAKPKFSFADDSGNTSAPRPASAWPAPASAAPRPAAAPASPPPRPQFQPQMQPPRPQLGGATTPPPSYPPIGQPPSYGQPGQGYGQPYQPPYNPGYSNPYGQQPPSYRPVDPATGYTPPPGFNPQPSRGNIPAAAPSPRFSPTSPRGPAYAPVPQQPQLQIGPALDPESDTDDIFETAPQRPAGRRATANDYSQAYQDDLDYDDAPKRSGSFGMILGLLLLGLLVALGVVFGYSRLMKPQTVSSGGNVPVVSAPATPTKSTPDANTSQQGDGANKKLIYDRIEGDHEVPGGPLKSTEQAPAAQQGGDAQPQQGGGATNGDASQPVPLPPPPGGNNGQQGALSPDANSNVANAASAAGQNPAANSSNGGSSSTVNVTPASAAPDANAASAPAGAKPATQDASIPAPPAPGETPAPLASTQPSATDGGDEQIGNTKAKPVLKSAAKPASTDTGRSAAADPTKGKSLGSAPLVLVPPSKTVSSQSSVGTPIASTKPSTAVPVGSNSSGGLYGNTPTAAAPQQVASAAPSAIAAQAPKAGTGAYMTQLSSFGSRDEATQEYQRLSAKHGALITRYAPIITQSSIAGSPRYNLNLGPMASNDVASSVCSSLIAAGERDCAVRRQ